MDALNGERDMTEGEEVTFLLAMLLLESILCNEAVLLESDLS